MRMLEKSIIKIIENKIPKDLLPDETTEHKLMAILDVWQDMRKSNIEYREKFDGLFKDFEYTLNLLNLAEKELTNKELKQEINKWLDYYRKLSKTGKL